MLIKVFRQSFSSFNNLRLFSNTLDHNDEKWNINFSFIPPTFNNTVSDNSTIRIARKSMLILTVCDKAKKYEKGNKK